MGRIKEIVLMKCHYKMYIAAVLVGAVIMSQTAGCGRKEGQASLAESSLAESIAEPTEVPIIPAEEVSEEVTAEESQVEDGPEEVSPAPETEGNSPYTNGQEIYLDPSWTYADHSKINSGCAIMYTASENRKNIIIGVNAGHGTHNVGETKTLCHPDGSPKVTGGTTGAGATEAIAVSSGMDFADGTPERVITLKMARMLRDRLLAAGYDVLMIRDDDDVQLDNVARTVICNNIAACHISIHWDGDGLDYDKGCFYMGVPEGLRTMPPVDGIWQEDEALGAALIEGLRSQDITIYGEGRSALDLTQTSYSSVPSVDIELGNTQSDISDERLSRQADGLLAGIDRYFSQG